MRINSGFHDYYDVVMGEGQDQSLVYQRHKTEELMESFPFHSYYNYSHRENSPIQVKSHHIGFCGKIYTVLEMFPTKFGALNTKEARDHRRWCYTLEDVDGFVKTNFKSDDVANYFAKGYAWAYNYRRHNFETFFKKEEEFRQSVERRAAPLFENLRPIFVAEYDPVWEKIGKWGSKQTSAGKIAFNCSLKQYEFYRIFPPFQAFQEINMWLSNQAVPIKPIPEIPDETMAEIKGFDKWSFRKEPGKKKRK